MTQRQTSRIEFLETKPSFRVSEDQNATVLVHDAAVGTLDGPRLSRKKTIIAATKPIEAQGSRLEKEVL